MRTVIILGALLAATPALAQTNTPPILDGAAIIGAPPAPLSPAQAADTLAMNAPVTAERLAQANADIAFGPWSAMAPVLGESFTAENLPRTARMFDTAFAALRPAIGAAKDQYQRARPYADNRALVRCGELAPDASTDDSYPSGHGAAGWMWALLLAELLPERADAVLARGRDYGDSRVICGFHYPGDIAASRTLAASVVARLHADADFRRELDAARRELARAYGENER